MGIQPVHTAQHLEPRCTHSQHVLWYVYMRDGLGVGRRSTGPQGHLCTTDALCHSRRPLSAGLRLVAAIVESKLILGTTVIKTGVQVWCRERFGGRGSRRAAHLLAPQAHSTQTPARHTCTPLHRHAQIAGTVVTVSAVTLYMFLSWRESRREARLAAAPRNAQPAAATELSVPDGLPPPAAVDRG